MHILKINSIVFYSTFKYQPYDFIKKLLEKLQNLVSILKYSVTFPNALKLFLLSVIHVNHTLLRTRV